MAEMRFIFVFIAATLAVVSAVEYVEVAYSRELGSGGETQECYATFKEFPNAYLRGVKKDSYNIWYNNTNFEDCKALCCFAEDACLSFSYYKPLEICFIMNMTKDHDSATVVEFRQWRHYQKVFDIDTTIAYLDTTPQPTLFPPGQDPGSSKGRDNASAGTGGNRNQYNPYWDPNYEVSPDKIQERDPMWSDRPNSPKFNLGGGSGEDPVSNSYRPIKPANPNNQANPNNNIVNPGDFCPLDCQHGGRCEIILVDQEESLAAYNCLCIEDYTGPRCEHHMAKHASEGPADYVIALVCLAIIIVILFAAVLIAFYLNRYKTGKYRVRKERERWNRRRKQRGNQSFVNSPTGSLAASEGSVRSGSDRSTSTLV